MCHLSCLRMDAVGEAGELEHVPPVRDYVGEAEEIEQLKDIQVKMMCHLRDAIGEAGEIEQCCACREECCRRGWKDRVVLCMKRGEQRSCVEDIQMKILCFRVREHVC